MITHLLSLRSGGSNRRLACLLVAAAAGLSVLAGPFRLDAPTLSAGGGRSVGNRFSLESTLGQTTLATVRSARFGLTAGIQATIETVPGPGLPQLRFLRDGQALYLEWVSDDRPSFLQFNPELPSGPWLDAGVGSAPAGWTNRLPLGVLTGHQFFRLRR